MASAHERAEDARGRQQAAEHHRDQVQPPGGDEAAAAGRHLPRADLALADEIGVVARRHVVEVVVADRAHAALRVREPERQRAELHLHPALRVAAVGAEVVGVEVDATRVAQRERVGVGGHGRAA